jgi:hypothetical protein
MCTHARTPSQSPVLDGFPDHRHMAPAGKYTHIYLYILYMLIHVYINKYQHVIDGSIQNVPI